MLDPDSTNQTYASKRGKTRRRGILVIGLLQFEWPQERSLSSS
jgi:hypothetical protein